MTKVSIAEAKDSLPALVTAAQGGETITITRHGRPVAELRPVASPACAPRSIDWIEAQLASLPSTPTDPAVLLRAMRDDE